MKALFVAALLLLPWLAAKAGPDSIDFKKFENGCKMALGYYASEGKVGFRDEDVPLVNECLGFIKGYLASVRGIHEKNPELKLFDEEWRGASMKDYLFRVADVISILRKEDPAKAATLTPDAVLRLACMSRRGEPMFLDSEAK